MKIYEIDARAAFTQEENPNITNGLIYSANKKTALQTARKIVKEVTKYSNSVNAASTDYVGSHEWAQAGSGAVLVYCITSKSLPIRTLSEALLNNGDWVEDRTLVFERSF
jgi:hypothetical protein